MLVASAPSEPRQSEMTVVVAVAMVSEYPSVMPMLSAGWFSPLTITASLWARFLTPLAKKGMAVNVKVYLSVTAFRVQLQTGSAITHEHATAVAPLDVPLMADCAV